MSDILETTAIKEFHVHLENTIVRLLIGEGWDSTKDKTIPAHIPHIHVCSELFVCGTGEVILKTENGYITLHAGDAAIVPPGVYHVKYRTTPDTVGYALSFLCIRKSTRDCTDLYKKFLPFVNSNQILVYRKQPSLFTGIQKIIQEAESAEDFTPALHLTQLLLKAIDLPLDKDFENTDKTSETVSCFNDMQRMLKLDQLIETYYMQNWRIDDIAEQLFISSRQLDRIVRKRYGKTLYEVIMDKRIQSAEQLLVTTDMTVDRIAVTVGFSSSAGFYREFSKRYDTTPAEYRKRYISE